MISGVGSSDGFPETPDVERFAKNYDACSALEYTILVGTGVPAGPFYRYHCILKMCRHGGTAPTKTPILNRILYNSGNFYPYPVLEHHFLYIQNNEISGNGGNRYMKVQSSRRSENARGGKYAPKSAKRDCVAPREKWFNVSRFREIS
ncbi:hypothetical protein Desti_3756 [Desulfomonile tiedjei DSM 6799]|uniref:Uncharacterized protein n=1 Tax=Desulfomonile tiedjei (strain ATCC 49306 / DSM 6799 / DCB-1) TaxID=706587 RepID=I4CA09_DESTA|nr:hypothetical protein Desti_3756 [Desulfomonile tiedjei DSM 6799]